MDAVFRAEHSGHVGHSFANEKPLLSLPVNLVHRTLLLPKDRFSRLMDAIQPRDRLLFSETSMERICCRAVIRRPVVSVTCDTVSYRKKFAKSFFFNGSQGNL
jgi:hypothetical protein